MILMITVMMIVMITALLNSDPGALVESPSEQLGSALRCVWLQSVASKEQRKHDFSLFPSSVKPLSVRPAALHVNVNVIRQILAKFFSERLLFPFTWVRVST